MRTRTCMRVRILQMNMQCSLFRASGSLSYDFYSLRKSHMNGAETLPIWLRLCRYFAVSPTNVSGGLSPPHILVKK